MRDYKFRGKRLDNGEWVEGCFCYDGSGDTCIEEINDLMIWEASHVVDPATVGQYTGLHDKDGREIYEGDIIKLVTADYEEINITCEFGAVRRKIFENEVEITGFYFVRSNDGRKTFPITNNYLKKHDTEIWSIIGNIHDNPELMEARHD